MTDVERIVGRPRTEKVVQEVAVVEQIPTDAQMLGLTDLTAPGLALATTLNPDNPRQMRRARMLGLVVLAPFVVVAVLLWLT